MCGIAGYITKDSGSYKFKVATAILAKNMEERGGHSWGYMTDTTTTKGVGSIDFGLRIPRKMPLSFALHTRYATTGAKTVENAHPFTVSGSLGVVVGVHNGIISNHVDLNRQYQRACVVDSQHIFHHLANGVSLDDLQGYGAIVYTLNGVWHIGRFNDGDMKVAMTASGIFYASTKDAVEQAVSYADLTIIKWLKVSNNTVYRLTADGLTKAYRIKAEGTRQRWNDALVDETTYGRDWWKQATQSTSSGKFAQECDYCGGYEDDVYELDNLFVCAECYCSQTGEVPAGYVDEFERSAYSYAASKMRAQA